MSGSFREGWEWKRIWTSASCFALLLEEPFVVFGVGNFWEVPGFNDGKHDLEAFALDGAARDTPINVDVNVSPRVVPFRGTWQLGLLSSKSGTYPYRDYSVRRCRPIFPYLKYSSNIQNTAYF